MSEHVSGEPEIRFRMRIRTAEHIALGPGKVALLEAIQACGSISAAARHLGMSYRRAWLLVDELNRTLAGPATVSAQGGNKGGSCVLTPLGEQVVHLYREIETVAYASCEAQLAQLCGMVKLDTK